jgi:uncharacterized damage-inducible protein DinB
LPEKQKQEEFLMSMLPYFQRLFAYDDWANREVLASLQSLQAPPPRSLKFLAHILSAERLWLERLLVQKPTYPVWPVFSLEQCGLEVAELPGRWKNYLGSLKEGGLIRDLTYKNSKGESWTSQRQDILMHVIMHAASFTACAKGSWNRPHAVRK